MEIVWILICGSLVFFMQAGFTCYEAGMVQSKNVISVAIERIFNLTITIVLFAGVGFIVMFGTKVEGTYDAAFFFLQIMFAAVSVTIFAGAISERTKLSALLIAGAVSAGLIYPVFGRWAWGGQLTGHDPWLAGLGFMDFAGASVVHMTAGFIALAGVIVVGRRKDTDRGKSNIPMAVLGVFILWFGWFGFNGGCITPDDPNIARVFVNTTLSAAFGTLGALGVNLLVRRKGGYLISIFNGVLCGLVAITAMSAYCGFYAAIVLGLIAGVFGDLSSMLLDRLGIDDVVKVVPTHLVGGIIGCLALPFLIDSEYLAAGSRLEQFGVQIIGVFTNCVWVFGLSLLLFIILKHTIGLRVTEEEEEKGLNIVEYSDIYSWEQYIETSSYERKIQDQNDLLRKQSRLLTVTEEQEKDKLAKDFHDGVGQSLSALKVILGMGKAQAAKSDDEAMEKTAEKAAQLADTALKEMRNILNNLKPEVLEKDGLEAALKDMTGSLDQIDGFECELIIEDELPSFDDTVELNLYRLVQECLTNVVKHANAKKATVKLTKKDAKEGMYMIIVRDNGEGFSPKAENLGVGIPSMNDRVKMMGGNFDVYSMEGKGTEIVMEVPY